MTEHTAGTEPQPATVILPEGGWPEACPLPSGSIIEARQHAVVALQRFVADEQLPQGWMSVFPRLVIPMAAWLLSEQRRLGRPLVMAIGGSQGSGKTTFSRALRLVLHHCFAVPACVLSLDDFYLSRSSRLELANSVHPLLATRGVPGTHEIEALLECVDALQAASHDSQTLLPRFDKSRDDRAPTSECTAFQGRPGVIFLEGWCLGAQPVSEGELALPINQLEAEHDPEGHWRRYVNEQLAGRYKHLFQRFDRSLFLQAPSWNAVKRWRLLQEAKLIRNSSDSYRAHLDEGDAFDTFMAHYERITRRLLDSPPATELRLALDEQQRLATLTFNSTERYRLG
ncbi:hypothetical protein [Salicola sp. Rm-C-2C1-2]|uniref:hypothetical protein n=1 Tax=Salicola sp. Rm-C-2C1-2 TaxID=3141321 RepID=UPI0032E48970